MRYNQQFGPGGLKTGVGLVLDLGASHDVSEVDLTTVGSPTVDQRLRLGHQPRQPGGAHRRRHQRRSPPPTAPSPSTNPQTGRYVVVWLTKLPAVPGGFRGGIAEAVVKGG